MGWGISETERKTPSKRVLDLPNVIEHLYFILLVNVRSI